MREAATRDRPILLSVGYAACHWCHVMAHESFEDEQVAELMNSLYVNVKVDREERPDIDQIYMSALSSMGEQGGWPLTMFLTPDGRPFWGGTYFPKISYYGRPGFIDILQSVNHAWNAKREQIDQSASSLKAHVQARLSRITTETVIRENALAGMASALLPMMDMQAGGLKGAPKFSNAPSLNTLWLQWLSSGELGARDAVLLSLRKILNGGIYDHVGGGLARYSTDAIWMIPHFEKMLYDNALLLKLTNWAFAETGEEIFRERIEQTIAWLLREMLVEDGFASSLDADSDGEEGLFYTWTEKQLEDALGKDRDTLNTFFSLGTSSQWEGAPVLFQTDLQSKASIQNPRQAGTIRQALLDNREASRVRPGCDDKVLTDWNGLALQALAEAGRSLKRPDWITAASQIFERIMGSADTNGRLPHSVRGNRRLYPAFSSDYAAMTNAAVSLTEATGDRRYLEKGRALIAQLDEWYGDDAGIGHFLTASDSADVPIRVRGDVDEAVQSANAQVIEAIARLASATGDFNLARRAELIAEQALSRIHDQHHGQAGIINAAAIALNPIKLVLIDSDDSRLVAVANRIPDPRRVDVIYRLGQGGDLPELTEGVLPLTEGPGAWLCTQRTCLPVIKDTSELERALKTHFRSA